MNPQSQPHMDPAPGGAPVVRDDHPRRNLEPPFRRHRSLARALGRILASDQYTDAPLMRKMYAFDASPFIHPPEWVLFPQTTQEVADIVKLARDFQTTVTPRGAGTGLSGGSLALDNGLCLCTSRMNRILDMDPVSRTALVQPGVVNLDLQAALAPHGLFFPPDPGSQKVATIGGNVANCAGGIQGARYGVTKNYILGMEVVLADGTTITTGHLNSGETLGPNPSDIFNGSEGSLGIITKILVHLLPRPQALRTALATFSSLEDAARSVSAIIGKGIIPTALELMDQAMLRAVDDFLNIGFPREARAVLLMEVDGFQADLDHQLTLMAETCTANGATGIQKAVDSAERDQLWKARRSGNGALGRIRPAYMVHDVTVPRNQLPALLEGLEPIGKKHGIFIAQMAHAGDGNAHPHMLFYPEEEGIQDRLHRATEEMFRLALSLGGTITGEHGVGLEKQAFMGLQFSRADLDFMEGVKQQLDPDRRINPGKTFPGPGHLPPRKEREIPAIGEPGRVVRFIQDNLSIEVTGAMTLGRLFEIITPHGAWLPLCPVTQGHLTLEELVFEGAHGHQALALGSLKEFIYGMAFTPHNGPTVTTGGHTAKNVAGTDFTRLLWRSRGQLGRINTITLKLLPRPQAQILITAEFPDLKTAQNAALDMFTTPVCLSTLKAGLRPGKSVGLVAGLMGSAALTAVHKKTLIKLLETWHPARQIHAMDTDTEQNGLWQSLVPDPTAPSRIRARGCRSALFGDLFPAQCLPQGLSANLDFGYPGMELWGSVSPGKEEELVRHLTLNGSLFATAQRYTPPSPMFNRLIQMMNPGDVPAKGENA